MKSRGEVIGATYRTKWMKEELGSAYPMLTKLKHAFDPNGIMNQGVLIPQD